MYTQYLHGHQEQVSVFKELHEEWRHWYHCVQGSEIKICKEQDFYSIGDYKLEVGQVFSGLHLKTVVYVKSNLLNKFMVPLERPDSHIILLDFPKQNLGIAPSTTPRSYKKSLPIHHPWEKK